MSKYQPKEILNKAVNFRLSDEDQKKLEIIAEYHSCTQVGWLRQAIAADWLEVRESDQKGEQAMNKEEWLIDINLDLRRKIHRLERKVAERDKRIAELEAEVEKLKADNDDWISVDDALPDGRFPHYLFCYCENGFIDVWIGEYDRDWSITHWKPVKTPDEDNS